MIDIHSHILFSVDDGAKDIEESINLIEQAIELGYTDVVCSSHYYIDLYENENYDRNFDILKSEIEKRGLNIKIHKGNEIRVTDEIFEKLDGMNPLGNSKYILVEITNRTMYQACKNSLKKFIELGYKPVLAHIERYPNIKMSEFLELYSMGVVFQMNVKTAETLTEKISYLLKNGYIKVVATDTHHLEYRNYKLQNYFNILKDLVGEKHFEELTTINPQKILENKEIDFNIEEENNDKQKNDVSNGIFKSIWSKLFSRT